MKVVHLVKVDDWAGVYIEDECIHQGHDVPDWMWRDLLKQGPFEVDDLHWESDHAYRVADGTGQFPRSYTEFLEWQP